MKFYGTQNYSLILGKIGVKKKNNIRFKSFTSLQNLVHYKMLHKNFHSSLFLGHQHFVDSYITIDILVKASIHMNAHTKQTSQQLTPHCLVSGPFVFITNGSILTQSKEKIEAKRTDQITTMVGVLFCLPIRPFRNG